MIYIKIDNIMNNNNYKMKIENKYRLKINMKMIIENKNSLNIMNYIMKNENK